MSERNSVREVNALTIMPLPIKIPASWYDLPPRVLPLVRQTADYSKYCLADEIIQLFLKKWGKVLIRNDGSFVWVRLGGIACYQVIPSFVRRLRQCIDSRDIELAGNGGTQALVKHWRDYFEELKGLDDDAVLAARNEILLLLSPETWHEGLCKSWNLAAERAHMNFGKIRPIIRNWIAKYENRFNLDEPFGGVMGGRSSLTTSVFQ